MGQSPVASLNVKIGPATRMLQENLTALIDALNKSKPAATKGVYLRKVSVSSTMGPGVRVDIGSLSQAPAQ